MTDYESLYATQDAVCGAPFAEFVREFEAGPAGLRVLDLGCGQGRDALVAARCGHRVTGVDLSASGVRQMVQQAAADGLQVVGKVGDISTYQPTGAFDIVVLDRVLHMLADDDTRRRVLERMVEAIEPGGRLLVADTPSNLPMIIAFMEARGGAWASTLARKGFSFWQRTA